MKKLLVIACVGLLAAACQKEQPQPQYQFPTGQAPVPGGPMGGQLQMQEQSAMLKDVVKKDPKNLNAWIQLGNVSMDTQRFQDAVDAYTKALELDPKNVDVRVDLGTCYRGLGKFDLAVKEYKKALEMDPNHLNGHRNLGVVYGYDLKQYPLAVKEFEALLRIVPNSQDAPVIRQEIEKFKSAKK